MTFYIDKVRKSILNKPATTKWRASKWRLELGNGSNGFVLPANAYAELKPGEKYVPVVPAEQKIPEVTFRSVFWGLVFSVIFSAGSTFLTLKIAQGLEAAIPIAIIAVGLSYLY
ncbi:MAG: hypothetical protein HYU98_05910, partial [Deltaproteobacteria bacterium]|nr:hypothetical protein [Deltaproteobacteria bacterium]